MKLNLLKSFLNILIKNIKIIIILVVSILSLSGFTLFFYNSIGKELIVNLIYNKLIEYNKKQSRKISIGTINFKGFNTITLRNVRMYNENTKIYYYLSLVEKKIYLRDLLIGKIALNKIKIEDITVQKHISLIEPTNVPKSDELEEYLNSLSYIEQGKDSVNYSINDLMPDLSNKNLHIKLSNLYKNTFKAFDLDISISSFTLNIILNDSKYIIKLKNLKFPSKSMIKDIIISSPSSKQVFKTSLRFMGDAISLSVSPHSMKENIFIIKELTGTDISFHQARFIIQRPAKKRNKAILKGLLTIQDFIFYNKKYSDNKNKIEYLSMSYLLNIGKNFIYFDSSGTSLTINDFSLNPYFYYSKDKYAKILFSIYKPYFFAQDLFNSLPKGSFNTLKGIKTSGKLTYNFKFAMDTRQPDSLQLLSKLEKHNFQIKTFGNVDYSLINKPFTYTKTVNNTKVKNILTGSGNNKFVPFNRIPKRLLYAVLTSEDCTFFSHRGFDLESFRSSILKNLKQRRFSRGGSTITMQLVKNLFLTHKKNISRKLEEMLIVWLIESNRLVGKKRLIEIYLNIIDWGPNVHGIAEAAKFYFNKSVTKLNLNEAIFLAIIIPKPKSFKYFFKKGENGVLRPYRTQYFLNIANMMLDRGLISSYEFAQVNPVVLFKGPANKFVSF